jgi:hypothetical protein
LVLFSESKEIDKEYRFFIFDNQILDHSEYFWSDPYENLPLSSPPSVETIEYVKNIVSTNSYFTNNFCALDISKTDNVHKIIEVNSGLTSGHYDADFEKITDNLYSLLCKNLKIDEEKLYDYGIEGYETNDI